MYFIVTVIIRFVQLEAN